METQAKDLIRLQEIIDLISQYNKQDETADYVVLSFRKRGRGISPEEINRIIYIFSCVVNCPIHELVCKSRKRPLPDYRKMIAFYLSEKDVKLLDIAATLGWNDHSTVLSAKRFFENPVFLWLACMVVISFMSYLHFNFFKDKDKK